MLVQDEPNLWLTITHVPDTGIPVIFQFYQIIFKIFFVIFKNNKIRDKMVYAATKSTLLNHLGFHNFHNELHATNNVKQSLFPLKKYKN